MEHPNYMVSVCMIAYKHSQFIVEAIESIINQKTSFPFELVISEDCGPDNTLEICQEYAAKYPALIKLLPADKNRGMMGNFMRALRACTGKYIATCEGDDYWTDRHKLQKQFDIMEANENYSICVHNTNNVDTEGNFLHLFSNNNYRLGEKAETSHVIPTEEILLARAALFHTTSYFFRKEPAFKRFSDVLHDVRSGDFFILFSVMEQGQCYYLNEVLSSYRDHIGGITKVVVSSDKIHKSYIKLFSYFRDKYPARYHSIFDYQIAHYQYEMAEWQYSKVSGAWYGRLTSAYRNVRTAKKNLRLKKEAAKKQFACVE